MRPATNPDLGPDAGADAAAAIHLHLWRFRLRRGEGLPYELTDLQRRVERDRTKVRRDFYVYEYRCPKSLRPVYVGKGSGDRAWIHWDKCRAGDPATTALDEWLRLLRRQGLAPRIRIVFGGLREAIALREEDRLIALYGFLWDGSGTLLNRTGAGKTGAHFPVVKVEEIAGVLAEAHIAESLQAFPLPTLSPLALASLARAAA
jgi:hypothetical protein